MKIYNAEIYTMNFIDGVCDIIENGFIEIIDGKITEVCSGLPSEIDENDINADGNTVYPGFIDAHTHLGIIEDGLDFEGDDCNEISDPFTPQNRAIDGINPFDRCFEEARKSGVTTVASCPGSANACGGEIAFIKTNGRIIDEMIIDCVGGMKFALGENPKRVYNDKGETPVTRMAIASIIRDGLHKARHYMADYDSYLSDSENFDPPDFDLKCEALLDVLRKNAKAYFHCHRADDIATAIRISKEFNLDTVIVHGTEGYLISDFLAKKNIPVICGPVICDRCKPEMKGLDIKNTAELVKSGVKTAICTDHTVVPIQYLPTSAHLTCKGGLSFIEALKNITINPAEIIGADEIIGSIAVGKDADLQIYEKNQSPFELVNDPKLVMINGVII